MTAFAEIETLMQAYIENLHDGDISKTDQMFLPECDLCCANEDGSYVHMTLEKYKEVIGGRESPKSKGYPVYGHTISIDQSGPNTAFVKIDCAVQPRYFIDYLSLVRTGEGWKIAAKVYYVQRTED